MTTSLPSHPPLLCPFLLLPFPPSCSAPAQRAPGASPSAHNVSSAAVTDRANFSRGVGIRSTFHAGQQRGARDQQGSAYSGGPASPSLSHGNSQARRTHGATGIFSKFTSKFVRRWVIESTEMTIGKWKGWTSLCWIDSIEWSSKEGWIGEVMVQGGESSYFSRIAIVKRDKDITRIQHKQVGKMPEL